jgi:hypothetical protein
VAYVQITSRGWLKAIAVVLARLYELPFHQEGPATSTFLLKAIPFVFLAVAVASGILHSQQEMAPTVELLDKLPDGTPPPPQPPQPGFITPSGKILSTESVQEGGRTITIQEIKPIALPSPPPSEESVSGPFDEATRARFAELRASRPRINNLNLGATVYLSENSPTRSLVRLAVPGEGNHQITFWSSADFSLLAGVGDFRHEDGTVRRLMLMWSPIYMDRMAALLAKHGRTYTAPVIPELPSGKASFVIVSGTPSAANLADIQALHDLYNSQLEKLNAAHQDREQARLIREAELKAHPPQPKDITLSHWRIGGGEAAPEKGGDK